MGYVGVIFGIYWDNGKENGSYWVWGFGGLWFKGFQSHMSYTLNSLKGVIKSSIIGIIQGDIRSLDCSSNTGWFPNTGETSLLILQS